MVFALRQGWSKSVTNEVDLLLEEWLANVSDYGVKESLEPRAAVEIQGGEREAVLRLEDNGSPFDPTARVDPDISAPAEARPVGGLGIFMIKKLCARLEYQRMEGLNVLRIWKDIRNPALGEES